MSRIADYTWQIEQAQRREAYLNRVRATTSEFVGRYEAILAEVSNQGLDRYVSAEFGKLRSALQRLRGMLASDPEGARDASRKIAQEVHTLPRIARDAQRHAVELEQQRRQQLSVELRTLLDQVLGDIADPVEREFAYAGAATLRDDLEARVASGAGSENIRRDVASRLEQVRINAQRLGEDWIAERRKDAAPQVRADVLRESRTTALAAAERNPAALRELAAIWDALDDVPVDDDFQKAVYAASDKTDAAVVDEECCRTAVRAVFESLQGAGFAVDPPRRETDGGGRVVVLARKPSGRQAEFRIDVAGGLSYKFDHYEGAACKQDIDQVLPLMQKIYGIDLSNERIRWENPDRLSRDARPLDDQENHRG
jgi:hypothetical protein